MPLVSACPLSPAGHGRAINRLEPATKKRTQMVSPHQYVVAHPIEKVIDAALRALGQLHFKIDRVDKQNGLITFKTAASIWSWGQELSILITKNGTNDSVIDIGNRLRFRSQRLG
jgi:hypothetical protein